MTGGGWATTMEGYAGGSIIIKCKYEETYRHKSKYICKDKHKINKYICSAQITSNHQGWQSQGRFSVYDNKDQCYLKLIMRDLTKSDEGMYWCVVDRTIFDEYTEINLKVKEGKNYLFEI